MNLKPILEELSKKAFTVPGLESNEMIMFHDVAAILQKHFGDEELAGSANVVFLGIADDKLKKKYSHIQIEHVQSMGRMKRPVPVKKVEIVNVIDDGEIKEEKEAELPQSILSFLQNRPVEPSALDKHAQDGDNTENIKTPGEPGNGETV